MIVAKLSSVEPKISDRARPADRCGVLLFLGHSSHVFLVQTCRRTVIHKCDSPLKYVRKAREINSLVFLMLIQFGRILVTADFCVQMASSTSKQVDWNTYKRANRPRKRIFQGNQYIKNSENLDDNPSSTVSSRKLSSAVSTSAYENSKIAFEIIRRRMRWTRAETYGD